MTRFLALAFNVAVVTFLVYTLFEVGRRAMPKQKKAVIITAGIFLLIVPCTLFLRVVPFSMIYFLLYPVAVSLFIYLVLRKD